VHPFFRQRFCHGKTNPDAPPSNDGDFPGKTKVHGNTSSVKEISKELYDSEEKGATRTEKQLKKEESFPK
jgi:hypothetical protein